MISTSSEVVTAPPETTARVATKGAMHQTSLLFQTFVAPPSRRVVVRALAATAVMTATLSSVLFQIQLPVCAEPPMAAEMPVLLRAVAVPRELQVPLYGWGKFAPLPDWST